MLAAHDHHNLDGIFSVPADAVENGAAAMGHIIDVVGDLLPLLADDLELDTLARVVDDAVGGYRVDDHVDETIHDFVDRVEQQVGRADDENVTVHHRAAKRDCAVLSYHGGDNVGASGAATVGEHHAQTKAT